MSITRRPTPAHMDGCPFAQANPSPCPYCDGVDAEQAAAPESSVVIALTNATNRHADAEEMVIYRRNVRDVAVTTAKAAGMSVEDIALTTGLSVQRVYQIVSAR